MSTILEKRGFPPITFNKPGHVVAGLRNGRNIGEGYQRGVSLEYGNMTQTVDSHPLFREALLAAERRSVLDYKRTQHLFEPLASQNIAEFGCFCGGSLILMGKVLEALYPEARIHGFDSFADMPVHSEADLHRSGDFDKASLEEFGKAVAIVDSQAVGDFIRDHGFHSQQIFPHFVFRSSTPSA